MIDKIGFFVLVPMVYLAAAMFVIGLLVRFVGIMTAPRHAAPLHLFPKRQPVALLAVSDTFTMPQVRVHAPVFWVFLMVYHVGFLLLILGHLDLFPGIRLMPAASPHMLGWGAVGVAVTIPVGYFMVRRWMAPVREISTLGDYLLLTLLFLTFLTGDTISWANSWNQASGGFVIGKAEFGEYLQSLLRFGFDDPREILYGSHYIVVVLHVLLANLVLIVFPFTKFTHTFLALPVNRLRRG